MLLMDFLDYRACMSGDMTADVDRRGQSRNVCGCSFNVDRERGGIPAEALRTDTQSVNTFQKLFFHIRIKRVGIAFGNGAAKRLFGEICAVFKIPAEAHADNLSLIHI